MILFLFLIIYCYFFILSSAFINSNTLDRLSKVRLNIKIHKITTCRHQSQSNENLHQKNDKIIKNDIRKRIDRDFITVSVPAFFSLAAEPLVTFIEATYVGQLGAIQQAGMGIASNAQFSVSKLYNDPLLKTATSLVADKTGDDLIAAVSTAISSAIFIGTLQCLVFVVFAGPIMDAMGVSKLSNMRTPAMIYLRWRAAGVPASTVLLVSNGIFRGRGDTITPLYCTAAGNIANIILCPILVFGFKMGCGGAGAATAISQWIAALPLLYQLQKLIKFNIFKQNPKKLESAFSTYFKAGGLILFRTISKISAYTLTASAAARLGTIPMAAYSLTFNLGFTAAQLCESVAISSQSLLAREGEFNSPKKRFSARYVIVKSLQITSLVSLALVSVTALNLDNLLNKMTSSPEVRAAAYQVMPIVLLAQIVKGISSPTGNILLGGCDWVWSSLSMNIAAAVCVGLVFLLPPTLQSIWIALTAFMSTQVLVIHENYQYCRGNENIFMSLGFSGVIKNIFQSKALERYLEE